MVSPENGHAGKERRLYRRLSAMQPDGYDVGEDRLRDMARRLAAGERVEAPWPAYQPASVLQLQYGISRARAYELLEEHATRNGRRYVLDKRSARAIDAALEPDRIRRALIAFRLTDQPSSTREAAERWVRRYLERHPDAGRVTERHVAATVTIGRHGTLTDDSKRALGAEVERIAAAEPGLVKQVEASAA